MSAYYTITVTDSLSNTATIELYIDIHNAPIPILIYNPIIRELYETFDRSTFYDGIIESDYLITFDRSEILDIIAELQTIYDQSFFSDTITGGGGGS